MLELRVFVEGEYDAVWVEMLLSRAFDRTDLFVSTRSCGGKINALKALANPLGDSPLQRVERIALIDADRASVADARATAMAFLRKVSPTVDFSQRLFFAVPEIEAWLFSDIEAARRHVAKKSGALKRVEFSDEIPMAKQFASEVFGKERLSAVGLAIAAEMNLDIAVSRSSSLRDFLAGVARVIQDERFAGIPDALRMLGPRLLGSLIGETNPSSSVIYRTLDGEQITAQQLADAIVQGTPLARDYASDLLRIARDQLAREARRIDDE